MSGCARSVQTLLLGAGMFVKQHLTEAQPMLKPSEWQGVRKAPSSCGRPVGNRVVCQDRMWWLGEMKGWPRKVGESEGSVGRNSGQETT